MKGPRSKGRTRSAAADRKARLSSPTGRRLSASRKVELPETVREDLAVELYALIRLALNRFGLSASRQRRAMERSWRLRAAPRTSGPLLRDARSLSALLLKWSRSPQYVDAKGNPRVLLINGPGDSFEKLAREFLPKMPLADVIDMACATTEVSKRPGGKIALIGDIMVNLAKSDVRPYAHAVRQIDHLLETSLHNAKLMPRQRAQGRMQRLVIGVIPRAEYTDFMSELRPQIADLMSRVDSSVENRRPRNAKALKAATAVSVGVYVAEENDWERAGIDAGAYVKGKRS
jgi:hypothetical protein